MVSFGICGSVTRELVAINVTELMPFGSESNSFRYGEVSNFCFRRGNYMNFD